MDQCTHEVRAQYWKGIILACQQRPAGQSAKQWMKENGILEQSYYVWQRKFRKEAHAQMQENVTSVPTVQEDSSITFAEIPCLSTKQRETGGMIGNYVPAAVLKTASLTIAITNEISAPLLSRIIREVSNA